MHKTILRYLLFTLLLILFLSIAAIIYLSTLDLNDYKGFVERAFKKNTGLELKLNGKIDLDIEDKLYLHVRDVSIYDKNGLLARFDSATIVTDFELPGDTLEIYSAKVYSPFYHFKTTGIDLFSTSSSSSSSSTKFVGIDTLEVLNGQFLLSNESDSGIIDVRGIQSDNAYFGFETDKAVLDGLFIQAQGEVKKLDAFDINQTDLSVDFTMENGYLNFENNYPKKPGNKLNFTLNLNPDDIVYHFNGQIKNEKIKRLYEIQGFEIPDFITGNFNADFDFNFSIPGDSLNLKSLKGKVNLTSSDAYLNGFNLDKLIKSYRRTQNFSMKDLGSVMILGPWGLALSKGSDYAELAVSSSNDSSHIEFLNFGLSVDSGILNFDDVAFRTEKNRVALSGQIDFVERSYLSFAYSLIQDDGCPEIREEFNGPFELAEQEGPKGIKILMGPVTNLFKGTSRIIRDTECKYPYRGVVEAPVRKNLFGSPKKSKKDKKEEKNNKEKKNKLFKKKS